YQLRTAFKYSQQQSAEFPSIGQTFELGTAEQKRAARSAVDKALKSSPLSKVEEIVRDIHRMLPAARWQELNARFDSDGLMDWSEAREMHRMGATIGSHCHDHAILHDAQTRSDVHTQLRLSR